MTYIIIAIFEAQKLHTLGAKENMDIKRIIGLSFLFSILGAPIIFTPNITIIIVGEKGFKGGLRRGNERGD